MTIYYLVNLEDPTDILPLNGSTLEDAAADAVEQLGWEILTEEEMENNEDIDEVPSELAEEIFAEDEDEPKRKRRKNTR